MKFIPMLYRNSINFRKAHIKFIETCYKLRPAQWWASSRNSINIVITGSKEISILPIHSGKHLIKVPIRLWAATIEGILTVVQVVLLGSQKYFKTSITKTGFMSDSVIRLKSLSVVPPLS